MSPVYVAQKPRDEPPSYRETISRAGYGFHHTGVAFEDVEAARQEYHQRGHPDCKANSGRPPISGRA